VWATLPSRVLIEIRPSDFLYVFILAPGSCLGYQSLRCYILYCCFVELVFYRDVACYSNILLQRYRIDFIVFPSFPFGRFPVLRPCQRLGRTSSRQNTTTLLYPLCYRYFAIFQPSPSCHALRKAYSAEARTVDSLLDALQTWLVPVADDPSARTLEASLLFLY
jgi:hypothetical protein